MELGKAYLRASLAGSARGPFAAEGRQKAAAAEGKNPGNQLEGEEVGEPGLLGLRAEFETGDARGHFVEFC